MRVLGEVGWVPWVLCAAAMWLCAPTRITSRSHRAAPRRHRLPVAGGVAAALACIALGGWPYGLVLATVVAPLACFAIVRLARLSDVPRVDDSAAIALDLAAAALRAGQTIPATLQLIAPATASFGDVLGRVGALLRLGADPREAWSLVPGDSVLVPLARAAARSDSSGARVAAAFERTAARIRADLRTAALARAARAGVSVLAPLGACFLPSFVCLGIAPVVVGVAKSTLSPIL